MTKVNMGNRIYKGIQYDKGKHGYTGYIRVYRVHNYTRVYKGM